jgi:hypothetical protein
MRLRWLFEGGDYIQFPCLTQKFQWLQTWSKNSVVNFMEILTALHKWSISYFVKKIEIGDYYDMKLMNTYI